MCDDDDDWQVDESMMMMMMIQVNMMVLLSVEDEQIMDEMIVEVYKSLDDDYLYSSNEEEFHWSYSLFQQRSALLYSMYFDLLFEHRYPMRIYDD